MKRSLPLIRLVGRSLGRSLGHLHRVGLFCVAAAALAATGGTAEAGIVTLGPNPVALPNCPDPVLPGKCAVDTAAQVDGVVGNLSAVRIGQSGQGVELARDGGGSGSTSNWCASLQP